MTGNNQFILCEAQVKKMLKDYFEKQVFKKETVEVDNFTLNNNTMTVYVKGGDSDD